MMLEAADIFQADLLRPYALQEQWQVRYLKKEVSM